MPALLVHSTDWITATRSVLQGPHGPWHRHHLLEIATKRPPTRFRTSPNPVQRVHKWSPSHLWSKIYLCRQHLSHYPGPVLQLTGVQIVFRSDTNFTLRLCMLAFHCLRGIAPLYLADSLRCAAANVDGRRHLCSTNTRSLVVPSTLGDRASPTAAWNDLPLTIIGLLTFCQRLKTFLFNSSFDWHTNERFCYPYCLCKVPL